MGGYRIGCHSRLLFEHLLRAAGEPSSRPRTQKADGCGGLAPAGSSGAQPQWDRREKEEKMQKNAWVEINTV